MCVCVGEVANRNDDDDDDDDVEIVGKAWV